MQDAFVQFMLGRTGLDYDRLFRSFGMKLALVLALLEQHWASVIRKNDATLYRMMWAGAALSLSLLLGFCHKDLWPWYFMTLVAGTTLIPSAVFLARLTWPKLQDCILRSGNIFTVIDYLDDEYVREKRLIDDLPLASSEKARLYTARYRQFRFERAELRALIVSGMCESHRGAVNPPPNS